MTSKNSFWVNLKENNKRRIAVWVVSLLTFVLCIPTYTAFSLNRWMSRLDQYIRNYGALGEQRLFLKLQDAAAECVGFNVFTMVFVTLVAVFAGIQGFSWLYSRKKIDFYMGMPVKRKYRFFKIWLNGILLFLVPYLLGEIVSLLIAAGFGAVTGEVIKSAAAALGIHLLLYLSVYHLAILAVMMTGNVLITLCVFIVFCLYEYVVRMLLYGYQAMFFRYYSYENTLGMPLLSPFTIYLNAMESWGKGGILAIGAELFLFALAVGTAAYFCYLKRPAEAAGKAMAFKITQPVVKILVVIPLSLLAGYIMSNAVNYYPKEREEGIGFVIFAIAVTVLIGSGLMQIIYEFDMKGALHKKSHILISGVAAALIFLCFYYDLTGYDSYVPAPEKVESIAFVPANYEGYMTHVDEWGNYVSNWEYASERMYLTDTGEICELAAYSMEQYDQLMEQYEQLHKSGESMEDTEYLKKYQWSAVTLLYRMKSGREITREIKLNVRDEKTLALLDQILGREEFKTGYFAAAGDEVSALFERKGEAEIEAFCGNGVYSNRMIREEAEEFFEIYKEDLKAASFMEIREHVPANVVMLDITRVDKGGGLWTYTISVNVYPFMEKSVAYLREKGYYVEKALEISDVEYIAVVNRNSKIREQLTQQQKEESDALAEQTISLRAQMERESLNTAVSAEYYEEEEIKALAECIYPREFLDMQWDGGLPPADDYDVIIYFKRGSAVANRNGVTGYYGFLEGNIPEFVEKDTLYRETQP